MMWSCNAQEQSQPQEPAKPILTARELVENNTYIDISKSMPEAYLKRFLKTPLTEEEAIYDNKTRAAHYRFYKHVKLENGHFTCDIKSVDEINISQELFERYYNKNIVERNKWIDEAQDRGEKIYVSDMTEGYLEALLSGEFYDVSKDFENQHRPR